MKDCKFNGEVGFWVCDKCGNALEYCKKHDAEYCPVCDEWKIDGCGDPDCVFCADRPEKPSMVKEEKDE